MRGYKKYFSVTGIDTETDMSKPTPNELKRVSFNPVKLNSASHDTRLDFDLKLFV